jgi:cyclic nucleotide gated channel
MQKRDQIVTWMKQNRVPSKIVARYKDYEDCMWDSFQGIEEQQILKSLPKSLRMEIRSFIFKGLMQNWEAFPSNSQGTVDHVIRMLKLVVYPRYEYIITAGEIA